MGELGAAEGPPFVYNWTARGLVGPLLPWLAILVLLALRPNRGWSAWWVWLPLACMAAAWHYAPAALGRTPKDVAGVFFDIPRGLAFGVAALWLLAPRPGRGSRFTGCLRIFLVLAVFGAFSLAVASGWDEGAGARLRGLPGGGWPSVAAWSGGIAQMLLLLALALLLAVAMTLTGLVCRSGRLRWLCPCFALVLPALMLAAAAAAHYLLPISLPVAVTVGVLSLLNLLPFLVLSASNSRFRKRLQALFHLRCDEPAPAPAPPPPAHAAFQTPHW